jgi:hypothetical protein
MLSYIAGMQMGMRTMWEALRHCRVNIGQVILSIRTKDVNAPVVMEAQPRIGSVDECCVCIYRFCAE